MKKTKSILIFVLSALLTLSLAIFAACGGGTTSGSGNSGGSDTCEHKVTYVKPDISATCTTDGRGYLTCKDCGKRLSNEVTTIPAKVIITLRDSAKAAKAKTPLTRISM